MIAKQRTTQKNYPSVKITQASRKSDKKHLVHMKMQRGEDNEWRRSRRIAQSDG